MPLPIALAQALAAKIDEVRISGQLGYLRPDGKLKSLFAMKTISQ
jgi:S-adenosylmethionine synthetase